MAFGGANLCKAIAVTVVAASFAACARLRPYSASGEAERDQASVGGPDIALVAFTHAGEMVVITAGEVDAIALPRGPKTQILRARGRGNVRIRSMMDAEGWLAPEIIPGARTQDDARGIISRWDASSFAIALELDPPLGDRREARVTAARGASSLAIHRIPVASKIGASELARSPDGRWLVLSVEADGRWSLYPIDVRETESALIDRAALEAYAEGDYPRAAALFEEAMRADPRAGDPVYNLACIHALEGDEERAAAELQLALAIDPLRYARLARTDPDLAAIRVRPELCARLSSCARRSE